MRSIWIALFMLAVALTWRVAGASTEVASGQPISASTTLPPPRADDIEKLRQAKQQIALLTQQVELQRSYQSEILATVYWALGGVIVIAGLLVGFGWFANFKVYERDKAALKAELVASSTEHLMSLDDKLGKRVDALSRAVEESIIAEVAKARLAINASVESLSRRVLDIELEHKDDRMRSADLPSIALTEALGLLELCERHQPGEIPRIIKFMLDKLDAGGNFTADEITRVNAVINKLPRQYKTLIDKLLAKMAASNIFDMD